MMKVQLRDPNSEARIAAGWALVSTLRFDFWLPFAFRDSAFGFSNHA